MNKKNYTSPDLKEIDPENIPDPKIGAAIQVIQLAANAAHKNRDVRHPPVIPGPAFSLAE